MLVGFKKRFTEPIQIGTKVFTMRKRRKVRPKVGETMYMYSALRTKHVKLISNKEKLISIQNARVMIEWQDTDAASLYARVIVDRRELSLDELFQFVRYDGFKSIVDWADYWLRDDKGRRKKRIGALMEIYHWTDLKY